MANIDVTRPLQPIMEFAKTGIVPPALQDAEAAIGKRGLFIVVIKLLQLIREEELPYRMNPKWTWCNDLPTFLERYPSLKSVLECGSDFTMDFASAFDSQTKANLPAWIQSNYNPPVDT